jgi:DNA-binding NarL/FixJ family response regulator
MTLILNQSFVTDFESLADTLDRPELQLAAQLLDLAWHRIQADDDLRNRWITLTPRQQEIATLIHAGHTFPEIAQMLQLSKNSVCTHARHLYARMGVYSKKELKPLMLSSELLAEYIQKYKHPES